MASLKSRGRSLSVLGRCELPFAVKDKKIMDLTKKEMDCGKIEHLQQCGYLLNIVIYHASLP